MCIRDRTMIDRSAIQDAIGAGGGVLRLEPCWVPRSFMHPGRRLRLHPDDLSAYGAQGGGILLKAAVEQAGDLLLGAPVMTREKGWNLLCKFFDNMGPIPHHLHQSDADAARVGRRGKPEAYYFPPQYNPTDNNYPYTFMGLEPGTTKEDVRRCLENWNKGDNGITYLSRAYRLERGTGWQIDPGILHAPGSLLTYEPQVNSDVFAMFQSEVEGRMTPWDLLVKDVPPDQHRDLDSVSYTHLTLPTSD